MHNIIYLCMVLKKHIDHYKQIVKHIMYMGAKYQDKLLFIIKSVYFYNLHRFSYDEVF